MPRWVTHALTDRLIEEAVLRVHAEVEVAAQRLVPVQRVQRALFGNLRACVVGLFV
jgi:hypothetical protein